MLQKSNEGACVQQNRTFHQAPYPRRYALFVERSSGPPSKQPAHERAFSRADTAGEEDSAIMARFTPRKIRDQATSEGSVEGLVANPTAAIAPTASVAAWVELRTL